ncbi:MAG: hypothetical protein WCI72_02745 [archaeon]
MEKLSEEKRRFKADTRNLIDVTLMSIAITLFGLIATIKPELLSENIVFGLQLALTLPLFMCGLLSRIKEATYVKSDKWYKLSTFSFTTAYGFFINVVGLILAFISPLYMALSFFGVNTLLTLVRAGIVVSYDKTELKKRIIRETYQILLIILLGVLPALRVY